MPAGTVPGALSGSPAAVAAAALARGASNGAAAGGPNDPQMSNFLFDDELDNELHNSTYGGRYLQMNADDDKFPVLIRRDSFPGIVSDWNAVRDTYILAAVWKYADTCLMFRLFLFVSKADSP